MTARERMANQAAELQVALDGARLEAKQALRRAAHAEAKAERELSAVKLEHEAGEHHRRNLEDELHALRVARDADELKLAQVNG